jgi:5-enolpyruvylshikimate-3-phosphate synthase
VSPAPPVEDTKAANALAATLTIAQNVRLITQDFPQAMETGRQILDLLQQMQAAVKGGQQPPETQAPPV